MNNNKKKGSRSRRKEYVKTKKNELTTSAQDIILSHPIVRLQKPEL